MKVPKRAPEKPKGPSKAQLRRIADLEARIAAADEAQARALAELDARRAALEAKHARARQKLETALGAARQAAD